MVNLIEERAARLMEFEVQQTLREREDSSPSREDTLQQGITRATSIEVRNISDREEERSIDIVVAGSPEATDSDEPDGVGEGQQPTHSSPARLLEPMTEEGSNLGPPSVLQTLSFLILGHYSLKKETTRKVFEGGLPNCLKVLRGAQYDKALEKGERRCLVVGHCAHVWVRGYALGRVVTSYMEGEVVSLQNKNEDLFILEVLVGTDGTDGCHLRNYVHVKWVK